MYLDQNGQLCFLRGDGVNPKALLCAGNVQKVIKEHLVPIQNACFDRLHNAIVLNNQVVENGFAPIQWLKAFLERATHSQSVFVDSCEMRVDAMHQQMLAERSQKLVFQEQVSVLQTEINELKLQCNASCSIATQTDSSPPDELEFLREENSKLHEMLREFHEMYDRISEKMKPTFSNRELLDSLTKDVQEAKEQHQIMKEQHHDLKHMLAQKQEALEVAQQELAATKQKLATTQHEQLDKLSHEHYDFMTERRQSSKIQKQLQAQLTKLRKELDAEQDDHAIDAARITVLEDQLGAKNQKLKRFTRKLLEENQKLQRKLQVAHILNGKLSDQGQKDQTTLSLQAGIIKTFKSKEGVDDLVDKTASTLEHLQDENITLRGHVYWYTQRFDKSAEKFTPPKQYVDDFKSMVAENKRLVAENTRKDEGIKYLQQMLMKNTGGSMDHLREVVKFDFEFLFGFFALLTRFFHNTLSDNVVFCNMFLEESMARIKSGEHDDMQFALTQADLNANSIIAAGDLFMQYITRRVMRTVGAKFFGAWKELVTKTSK